MAKAENLSLLKKLVEKVKQSKDALAPDDEKANEVQCFIPIHVEPVANVLRFT